MKRIVLIDTWVNTQNLGNQVIMDAIQREMKSMFPHDLIYSVPALEYVKAGKKLLREADMVFLGGANLLSANMRQTSEWCLRLSDAIWLREVVLFGVGWWQYQAQDPDLYSRVLLHRVLHRERDHSVRDSYTADRLIAMGIPAAVTGCPTIWSLTPEHCAQIPEGKSDDAVMTFTSYNQRPSWDKLLFESVSANYETVYLWPQQFQDYEYAKRIGADRLVFLDPNLDSLDDVLSARVDYVGTRLHAGIRALQQKRRAIIIGVDNRANEMASDFGLPVIARENTASELAPRITGAWPTTVDLAPDVVAEWKLQFQN